MTRQWPLGIGIATLWLASLGVAPAAAQELTSRTGVSIVYPVTRQHSLQFGSNRGMVTTSGGDFGSYSFSYRFLFR